MSDITAPDEAALRQRLADGYSQLAKLGLNSGSAGNISCRFGAQVLISPTGATAETIDAQAVVTITLEGEALGPGIPSSEWSMHTEIYRRYPNAQAIVHTHADACVAIACQRMPIPAFHYMVAGFGGDNIRCAPYETFGTEALAHGVVEALTDRHACLLANHGMICHAATIEKAVTSAHKLETLARQFWMSLHAGPPVLLTSKEMSLVKQRYGSYGNTWLDTRPK